MKRIVFYNVILTCILGIRMQAQDYHFSQFYASPLTLNPALTGKFNGNMRLSSIYRAQWSHVNTTSYLYQTPSFSADFNLFRNKIGLGVVLLNDQTNNKIFNTLEGGLSASYKIATEKFGISFGLQGWYSQNYFDYNKVNQSFRQTEPTAADVLRRFDFHAGVFSDYRLENNSVLYAGFSAYHLVSPKDKFSTEGNPTAYLPRKFTVQLGGDLVLNDKVNIIPGLMYANQASASQINTGATLAYYLRKEDDNNIILYGGLWSRWNGIQTQALIPKVGFEIKKIRITAAYDMVTNSLGSEVNASNSARPNTFELSLNYIFKNTERSFDYDCFLFNPRY
jgi:type IX secretion system PorP/SprF family membrane protein